MPDFSTYKKKLVQTIIL